MTPHTILLHVDVDSPAVLSRFWGVSDHPHSTDVFYAEGMRRALALFREFDAPATFFCVGEELDQRESAREAIRQAHEAGHEIANHTYTHSFSLDALSDDRLREEVRHCSSAIRRVTGQAVVGFRAPGYAIGNRLMRVLRELSFRYDSSVFWTPVTTLMRTYHRVRSNVSHRGSYGETSSAVPRVPYFPDVNDWKREGPDRALLEIPLPRSPFLLTPFYNNFHLMLPNVCRIADVEAARHSCLVYLFHLIEFCDRKDGIPETLARHPNLNLPVETKIARMRDTLRRLWRRYRALRTDQFAERCRDAARGA